MQWLQIKLILVLCMLKVLETDFAWFASDTLKNFIIVKDSWNSNDV